MADDLLLITFTSPLFVTIKDGIFHLPFAVGRYNRLLSTGACVGDIVLEVHGFPLPNATLNYSKEKIFELVISEASVCGEMPFAEPSDIIIPDAIVPPHRTH